MALLRFYLEPIFSNFYCSLFKCCEFQGGEGEVADLNRKIEELGAELKKTQIDRDTLRKQAESLQREYDRVSDILVEYEVRFFFCSLTSERQFKVGLRR